MGFTIDMVSGEILDETLTQEVEGLVSDDFPKDNSEYGYTEQLETILIPVSETTSPEMNMPESLSQTNVDSFLDQFN